MLIAGLSRSNLHGPTFLDGAGLNGNASIESLQRALLNLSIATQRPAINPGPIDGVVGGQTMAAVNAALGLLTEELPSWLYLALQAAMMVGADTAQAKQYVAQYAPQLTIAANTAAVKYKTAGPAPTAPAMVPAETGFFSTLFPTGWYKRPSLGWVLIGIGGLAFYKLFLASPSKTA